MLENLRKEIEKLKRENEELRKTIRMAERELWWGSAEDACVRVSDILREVLNDDRSTN